ncbi:MAG: glycine/sarcosine/betaine reductase selenoprotein B family protein [Bacillota bacterium]|nr:glycine/sarcosine/betaine reductase selenoprotein B family protein [Bacillota bacterium]
MESFKEFKDTFSYGKRNNLNFKFLSHLSEEEAADFIEGLLYKLGKYFNDGDEGKIIQHVVDGQIKAYSKDAKFTYDEGPFTKFEKELKDSKIGLITSSGHFVKGDDPEPFGMKNMTQEEAINNIRESIREKPSLSIIPKDTNLEDLKVRHGGYDISGAETNHNTVIPIEILKELEKNEVIKELGNKIFSFVGACAQKPLIKEIKNSWMEIIKMQNFDAVILVPV